MAEKKPGTVRRIFVFDAQNERFFPAGSGRDGRLILSISRSKMSFRILPKAMAKAKAIALAAMPRRVKIPWERKIPAARVISAIRMFPKRAI